LDDEDELELLDLLEAELGDERDDGLLAELREDGSLKLDFELLDEEVFRAVLLLDDIEDDE